MTNFFHIKYFIMFAVDNNHNYQNAMKTTLLTLATALLMD